MKMEKVHLDEIAEYLFLDLEWNQAPGTVGVSRREAIQIGVVAADEEMKKVKTFSRAIRLSDSTLFNPETERIAHTPLANVMQGRAEDIVLMNFAQTFRQYHYIVIWSRDTYELFVRDMKKYGISVKKHKVVVLQEILGIVTGKANRQVGFENALKYAEIEYQSNYLHYSKHDSNYLYQLFCWCYQQYSAMTMEEYCVANLATGKLHAADCRYVQKIAPESGQRVPKSWIFKGFTVCKCCQEKQIPRQWEWNIENGHKLRNKIYRDVLKQLPLTEKNIEKICKWFQISYSISSDIVFVSTAFSRWIVYLQDNKVKKLSHENYRMSKSQYRKKQKMKCTEGYHEQKLPSENFFEVIQYIKNHDTGTVKRMAKKSRLEKLLEMV